MNPKYYRNILLILILCLSFTILLSAQTVIRDSVSIKHENISYGSLPSWMVNGATSAVKEDKLSKSFTTNLGNTLSGRIPGLTVIPNGNEPGNDSPTLYIRGLNTYGTGKSVLVIVDGVESPYESLTPDEIETVTVLKDASATALYGSRGANGVLLVTTKRGTNSPMLITFSTQQGFRQAQRSPEFLGSYEYARLYNEALVNDGKTALYTQEDLSAYQNGNDPYFHPDVDWYSEVLRKTAPVSNYNLNFRGGNAGVKYFVLLNKLSDNGLYKRTAELSDNSIDQKYSRFNIRTNIDVNISKNLSATLLLGASIEDNSNPKANNTGSMFDLLSSVPPNLFPVYNPNGTFGGSGMYSNPLGDMLNTGFYTSNTRTFQTIFKMTEKLDMITKGLSTSVSASFNNYFKVNSNKSRDYAYYYILSNVQGDTIYNKIGDETSLSASNNASNQWRNVAWQVFLNYNRIVGSNSIDAMLMFQEFSYNAAGIALPYRYSGLSGRFTYANRNKYIADFSFAYNGTENFPKDRRWGLFPAFSLGWIVSNEGFMKGSGVIDYLKIRSSYGLVGNDNIGGTRFMFNPQPYEYGAAYFLGSSNITIRGIAEGQAPNPNVTWEKEKKMNIGFEATLLKQFDVKLDIFNNDRYDILSTPSRTVPQYLGFGALPDYNFGKTNNKGFEAEVTFNSKQNNDIQYYVTASVWYAKNKIVYNGEPFQQFENLYLTGHSINQPFRLEAVGLFKDQEDIDNSPFHTFTPVQPGDIKYKDQNDDDVIDQNDYCPIGNQSMPRLTAGLETGFKFRGFDFNMFFQGVASRSVYLTGSYYKAFQDNGKATSVALGRWTEETKETATYPRLSAENNLNNFKPSSFWERDGSFIKLRSIELGYNLPDKIVKKMKFSGARFFVNGTNLFSFDHMDFTDPETLTGYPALSTYSVGAKFQF